jgi:hypothetical protein
MFWVEFEEGHFPSSNIGDPSQNRLGVTYYPVILSEAKDLLILGGGKIHFLTNPRKTKNTFLMKISYLPKVIKL